MSMLLVGTAFLAVDVTRGSWTTQSVRDSQGTELSSTRGFRYDLVPDEVGHLLFIACFFAFFRLCQGAAKKWFLVLIPLQLVGLVGAVLDHFIVGHKPLATLSSDWVGSLNSVLYMAVGWPFMLACRELGLRTSEVRWRRFALWMTALVLLPFVVAILLSAFGESEQPLNLSPNVQVAIPVVFVLGGLTLFLWGSACLGTRSEARSGRAGATPSGQPSGQPGEPHPGDS